MAAARGEEHPLRGVGTTGTAGPMNVLTLVSFPFNDA